VSRPPLAPLPRPNASPRVRLARVALRAALAVPDVVGAEADARHLRVTADPGAGLLRGVSVTAEDDDRFAVDLRLVARMVPLVPLGAEVRRRVWASARREVLAAELGSVNVEFARVLAPEEALRAAAAGASGAMGAPG
jgi:hypothetical protein